MNEETIKEFSTTFVNYFKEIDRVNKKYSDKLIEFVKTLPKQEVSDEYTWKLAGDEQIHSTEISNRK